MHISDLDYIRFVPIPQMPSQISEHVILMGAWPAHFIAWLHDFSGCKKLADLDLNNSVNNLANVQSGLAERDAAMDNASRHLHAKLRVCMES